MASQQVKTVVISLMCFLSIGQPVEEFLDWEDFQAALVEDGSDEGISLLQSKVNVKFTSLPAEDSLSDLEGKADSSGAMDDISPDDFAETMSDEKVPEAVSLMQTEAHIQRSAIHKGAPTAMVTNADGSVVAESKNTVPQDGIIHMSVGVDGSFSWEGATEGLSLIQKEATLNTASKTEESPNEVEAVKDIPSEVFEDDKSEGVVLLQTDAHIQSVVTKADGSIVTESKMMPQSEDGMVQLVVDADGSSEAVSLIQRQASLKVETPKKESEPARTLKVSKEKQPEEEHSSMKDVSADSFEEALQSSVKGAEAVSLLQTDAHVHKASIKTAMVTEADGSIGFESEIAKPHDGIVHMSVGAHGTLQWEI